MQFLEVEPDLFQQFLLGQGGAVASRQELQAAVCLQGEGGVLGLHIYFPGNGVDFFLDGFFVIGDSKLNIPFHRGAGHLVSNIGGKGFLRVVAYPPGFCGGFFRMDFQLDICGAVFPGLVLVSEYQSVVAQFLLSQLAEKILYLLPAHA